MLGKIIKKLLGGNGRGYRKYSSSSARRYSNRHNHYGHKHYKRGYKKKSSRSFFSSHSFFSS